MMRRERRTSCGITTAYGLLIMNYHLHFAPTPAFFSLQRQIIHLRETTKGKTLNPLAETPMLQLNY